MLSRKYTALHPPSVLLPIETQLNVGRYVVKDHFPRVTLAQAIRRCQVPSRPSNLSTRPASGI